MEEKGEKILTAIYDIWSRSSTRYAIDHDTDIEFFASAVKTAMAHGISEADVSNYFSPRLPDILGDYKRGYFQGMISGVYHCNRVSTWDLETKE